MGLKSTRLIKRKKERRFKKGRPFGNTGRIVGNGITALIGVGLLSTTADAVNRI